MRKLIIALTVAAVAMGAIVGAAVHLAESPSNQYTIEDSLVSPNKKFVATRFQEATPFVACNEVVIVMPSSESFSSIQIERYRPYLAFSEDCSVEVRVRWSGDSALEISSTANRSESWAAKNWLTSPLGSQVSLSFSRLAKRSR